jgi:hypothetical protein
MTSEELEIRNTMSILPQQSFHTVTQFVHAHTMTLISDNVNNRYNTYDNYDNKRNTTALTKITIKISTTNNN